MANINIPRLCPICGANEINEYKGRLKCVFCDTIFDAPQEGEVEKMIRVISPLLSQDQRQRLIKIIQSIQNQ